MLKPSLSHLSALFFCGSLLILTACTTVQKQQSTSKNTKSTNTPTKTSSSKVKTPSTHTVKSGESLSVIAQKYNLEYTDIAKLNKISAPYNIKVGQVLNLQGLKSTASVSANQNSKITWLRPVNSNRRKLLQGKYHTVYYKGKVGDYIYASADGHIVYANLSANIDKQQYKKLNEKGNTIIITHAQGYNSAYSHLSRILVSAGSYVKAGQPIAEMGQTGNVTEPLLGFQIKYNGKFMNPRRLIP